MIADIGNRHAHIRDNNSYFTIPFYELFKYKNLPLFYISVNSEFNKKAKDIKNWINLAPYIKLKGAYSSMGIDRKALLLSRGDGIYIDAGSAITVDIKKDNSFIGGVIIPGIWAQKEAFNKISPFLKIDELEEIDLDTLPNSNTIKTLSYGIIAPIVALVEKLKNRYNLPIYITGGDGKMLSSYINGAYFKEDLIFEALEKIIKEKGLSKGAFSSY